MSFETFNLHPSIMAGVRELGYKSLSSVKTATLFTYFLKKNGNTQSAAALQDILRASEDTGVDFELLMVEAMLESNLGRYDRPIAVPSGAARGAFQFMPQTWLNLFNWFGGKIQNGKYQNLIDQMDYDPQSHQASVSDDAVKQQILDLRSNPYVAAYIKAMQIKNEDGPVLRAILGREPNKTDYYVAHVFGLPRAQTFYHHMNNNPNSAAARIMSKEARYNRYLFYNNGKQMSFKQVYDRFTRLIDIREDLVRNAMIDALNDTTCVAVAPRQISVPKIMLA